MSHHQQTTQQQLHMQLATQLASKHYTYGAAKLQSNVLLCDVKCAAKLPGEPFLGQACWWQPTRVVWTVQLVSAKHVTT